MNLADVGIEVSELSFEHYQLTKFRGTGTLFVSTGAEPKIRIIDEAVIMAKGEFVIEGRLGAQDGGAALTCSSEAARERFCPRLARCLCGPLLLIR